MSKPEDLSLKKIENRLINFESRWVLKVEKHRFRMSI